MPGISLTEVFNANPTRARVQKYVRRNVYLGEELRLFSKTRVADHFELFMAAAGALKPGRILKLNSKLTSEQLDVLIPCVQPGVIIEVPISISSHKRQVIGRKAHEKVVFLCLDIGNF